MSTYAKPHLSFAQQLDQLKTRGLQVADEPRALDALQRIGYYRLSAYWYPFRAFEIIQDPTTNKLAVRREDTFVADSHFEQAVSLYEFDRQLRLLVLDALERVEVAVRVDIAYGLGQKDPFAHENGALLHGNFAKKVVPTSGKTRHEEWLEKHAKLVARSSEDFVRHFMSAYGQPLPVWVAVELWDFGLLSTFFNGMAVADKDAIAHRYGLPNGDIFASWLRTLNYVRNVVAHHSRLWNRNLIDQPKLPAIGTMPMFDPLHGKPDIIARLYIVICILLHFMGHLDPGSDWAQRLLKLLNSFPSLPAITVSDMGFPADWQTHAFNCLPVGPAAGDTVELPPIAAQ